MTVISKVQEHLKLVTSHPEGAAFNLSETIDLLAEVANIEGMSITVRGSGSVYVVRLTASPAVFLREIGRL